MAKCKICKSEFVKFNLNHLVCTYKCLAIYLKNEQDKKWQRKKKELKAEIETYSDVLKKTQIIFNKYIRLRDSNKPCISCLRPLNQKYDAGHFLSTKQNNIARFNVDNVHAQCVHCNRDLHGNLLNYQINLVERIGEFRFNNLMENINKIKKYTKEELIEIQNNCKELIKNFDN